MTNPHTASDPQTAPDDSTLGGYFAVHDRPPAYDGPDGHPYTVSVEVEKTANLRAPYSGHVETPTLVECASAEEAVRRLGEKTLLEVQALLLEAIRQRDGDRGA